MMNTKDKISHSFLQLSLLILLSLILSIFAAENFEAALCIFNFFISILIVIWARISIVSIIIIISNYPIVSLIWAYFFDRPAASLNTSFALPLMMKEMLIGIAIFNIVSFLFVILINPNKQEKKILDYEYNFNTMALLVFVVLTLVSLYIKNPHLPFLDPEGYNERRVSLLAGNAWNYLMVCSFAFVVFSSKRLNSLLIFLILFMIIWLLGNYSRVELLGIILIFAARYIKWKEISFNKKIIAICVLGVVFTYSLFLGSYRVATDREDGSIFKAYLQDLPEQFIAATNQATAADIIHIYNSGFHFVESNGFLNGKSYIMYIISAIPFIGKNFRDEYSFTEILRNEYFNRGGGYFLTEPYVNFGYVGILIYSVLFYIMIYFIIRKPTLLNSIYYFVLWAAIFRVQWYGLIYLERSYIQIIPALFLLFLVLKNIVLFKYEYKIEKSQKPIVGSDYKKSKLGWRRFFE